MLPPADDTIPPPPLPPRRIAPLLWGAGLALAAVLAVVLAVTLTGNGGPSAASTTAASTTTTAPTTTGGATSTSEATTTSTTAGTTTQATTTSAASTTTQGTTTTTVPGGYRPAELDYFEQIAGQPEFGPGGGVVHKWAEDVRIAVYGDPTERDRAALDEVIEEINALIRPVQLSLVEGNPNVEIHFVPEAEFASIEPNYVPVNMGFVYIWWDGDGAITRGRVLISTTGLTPRERAHLIREELTQGLGLLNDSWDREDSIFYQGWTDTNRYAPIDRSVISMLYRPGVVPGMAIEEALEVLREAERG